jgi:hypothetical protein
MTFDDILAQVLELLQREKRVSYRALKLRFNINDDYIEGIKDELIYAKKLAVDEDGRVLVWAGEQVSASALPSAPESPALAAAPAVPWKGSASRSRCFSLTSKAQWSCWPSAIPRKPASCLIRCCNG